MRGQSGQAISHGSQQQCGRFKKNSPPCLGISPLADSHSAQSLKKNWYTVRPSPNRPSTRCSHHRRAIEKARCPSGLRHPLAACRGRSKAKRAPPVLERDRVRSARAEASRARGDGEGRRGLRPSGRRVLVLAVRLLLRRYQGHLPRVSLASPIRRYASSFPAAVKRRGPRRLVATACEC